MERWLALWVGVPFIGVAWTLVAVVALAPGFVLGRLLMALLLVLAAAGTLVMLFRSFVRDRADSPLPDTLYPIAGILVAIGVGFHQEVGTMARGIFDHVMPGGAASDGIRIARAEDGQFHIGLTIEGSAVDFVVDLRMKFNVLMPDVPRQVGINPSSLIYDERIAPPVGGEEYAAEVVLPKAKLGPTAIEHLTFKVFATNRFHNVLGEAFFERLENWHIDGDTLVIAP